MSRPQSAVREKPGRTPSEEHERLAILIGSWHTRGATVARQHGAAVPVHSSDVYEWLPGCHFVVHRWAGEIGDLEVHGLEIIGVDPETGMFRTHFFDSDGNSGSESLTVHGNTWTWLGQQVIGAMWHRCTAIVSDDGRTIAARHEQSNDGTAWTPWMDVTLRRDDSA